MAAMVAVFAMVGVSSEGTQLGVFDVRKFGAKGDGIALDTVAIASAFAASKSAGGGVRSTPSIYPLVLARPRRRSPRTTPQALRTAGCEQERQWTWCGAATTHRAPSPYTSTTKRVSTPLLLSVSRACSLAVSDVFTLVLVSATSRVSFAPNCKTVTFPPGTYLSGPIKFSSSSQTLEVQQGARVLAAWNRYGRMDPHNFSTTWPLGPLEPGERARAHALFLSLSLFRLSGAVASTTTQATYS